MRPADAIPTEIPRGRDPKSGRTQRETTAAEHANMTTLTTQPTDRAQPGASNEHRFDLTDIPVSCVGEAGAWLQLEKAGDAVTLTPSRPMPRRCTVRPVALFQHELGFVEANTIMGRLVFANGASEPQTYRPFSLDPRRDLRELFFPIEPMPEDDLPASPVRWRNCQAIAKRLLSAVDITWNGFSREELEILVHYNMRHEPLDRCALHALAQHTRDRGDCLIEIGSYRGSSASVQAMGLRSAGSDSLIISVDPHLEWPHNREQVRLALREIGEEQRLVQFPCISNRAARFLRPGCAAMVFIDGDHGHEQVVADFRRYLELLAPGGLMLFHDYCCGDHNGLPEPEPDVRRAVDEHIFTCDALRPLILAQTLMVFEKTR